MTDRSVDLRPATLLEALAAQPADRCVGRDLPVGRALDVIDRLAGEAAAAGVREGEVVGVVAPPGDGWVLVVLALARAGARLLLLGSDVPAAERARLLALAGAGRWATGGGPDGPLALAGAPAAPGRLDPGFLLVTSGTTGEAKVVHRSEASVLAEAVRYVDGVGLWSGDQILLPLPLHHAYALGWVAAGLVAGVPLCPVSPAAMPLVVRALLGSATIAVLVPSLARLLVTVAPALLKRGTIAPPSPGSGALRLAMAGAGPVDARLDANFRACFGIGLARNYGSTETGAVFAGPPQLPTGCVGTPLPGVEYRILDDRGALVPEGGQGNLEVRVAPGAAFRPMHDIARVDALGRLHILGRRSAAARRGDRFVAPLEVEGVLREAPGVVDVRVRRVGHDGGDDGLVADVVPADPATFSTEAVLAFARARLATHKVPDAVRLRDRLSAGRLGKAAQPQRLALGPPARLRAVARAHRLSQLLFALDDLGVLALLDGRRDSEAVAAQTGLRVAELEVLLDAAVAAGVVVPVGAAGAGDAATGPGGLAAEVAREATLAADQAVRRALCTATRTGIDAAATLAVPRPGPGTPAADALVALGWRPGWDVAEITTGPGAYVAAAAAGGATGRRVTLAPTVEGLAALDPGDWDLVVLAGVVHGPPADDLGVVLGTVREGGLLAIDDRFAPGPPDEVTDLLIDALSTGATSWLHADELDAGLCAAGADSIRRVAVGCAVLVVASRGRP